MGNLYFGTRKLAILAVSAMIFFACWPAPSIFIHDHALFFTGSTPPDTAIYCGVKASQQMAVPYTLYVSATAIGSDGYFQIAFHDRNRPLMRTHVGTDKTESITLNLTGSPNGDDVVKITRTDGVQSMMASVEVRSGSSILDRPEDPFDETQEGAWARSDNFCLTAPRDPGSRSAAKMIP